MKLDFNFDLKDLAGNPIPQANAAKLLGTTLSAMNKGNSIKLYDWALKLWNLQPLEIDDTDTLVLEEIIESSDQLTVISKAQMKMFIQNCKSGKEPEKSKKARN